MCKQPCFCKISEKIIIFNASLAALAFCKYVAVNTELAAGQASRK